MRSQRGSTLIELMIAGAIILIAILGFIVTMSEAARSTGIGQRRTVASQLRTAVMERIAVTQRDRMALLPTNEWRIDACFDGASRLVSQNAALSSDFACPARAVYRSWLRVEPSLDRSWAVRTYAERVETPCAPADRYRALYCVATDVLLTD
jgi:Tfp pilus assembly protein PilV